MKVLTKKNEKVFLKQTTGNTDVIKTLGLLNAKPLVAMTKGWQCCKCQETMYDDELNCTYDKCNHRRCSNCRSFTN